MSLESEGGLLPTLISERPIVRATNSHIDPKVVGPKREPRTSRPIHQGSFNQTIGRALTERPFREALLQNPMKAATELAFSRGERAIIGSIRVHTLEELASLLTERLGGESGLYRNGSGCKG